MKIKSFMTMMVAAAIVVLGVSSCGSDDDEPEVAVATQVAGSYTGNEVIVVMGEESSNTTTTYEFVKATDVTLDLNIPQSGEGAMTVPALAIKSIPLTKNGNTITGKVASYTSSVINASGVEKAYTINDLTVVFTDKAAALTFSLKYGNMPFAFATTFTGTKK